MQFSLRNNKSILNWLICITYAGLFFPIRISNIPLITLFVFCAIQVTPKEILRSIRSNPFALFLIAMFFLQIIGLLYSSNLKAGLFMLEKKICFLLVPLFVFPAIEKAGVNTNLLLKRIGFITLFSGIVLLCIAAFRKFILNDPLAFDFVSGNEFKGFTSIHYVYYAMYFASGSLILMDCYFDQLIKSKKGIFTMAVLILYAVGIMILVASKSGIIVFIIATISLFYFRLSNKKLFALSIIFLFAAASTFLYLNENTRNRFSGLDQDLSAVKSDTLQEKIEITGLNMRLLFWKISVTHLWNDGKVLTGVGTGDAQNYIDSLYNLPQYQLYGYLNWDSHNQWVYALLQVGVSGVIVLGSLYIWAFATALRRKDVSLFCFLLVTLVISFSESILELNKGITFFSIMLMILTAAYTRKEQSDISIN